MPLLPSSTDYTDKDFDSLRRRLFALVRSIFPEWTDENVTDFGNILVELFSNVGDILTFYQDNQARESRIVTATQRKSLLGLAKLTGYVPATASAAQAAVVFSIPTSVEGDVFFPNGTITKTLEVVDPVSFQVVNETAAGYTIPAGETSVTGVVENSESAQDTFTSSDLANQEFTLTDTPFLDGTLTITAADGVYAQQPNLLSSTSSDKHFTVSVDQNDRARVSFGNGTNGSIPAGTISAVYKTGGGSAGNVAEGSIRKLEGSFTDSLGNPVQVTITNPERAGGGNERTSNARIAQQAPEQIRAPINSVALEDFEINAERLPQVARALFLTRNQDPSVPENTGILYPIPTGGGYPTTELKALVKNQVTVVYPCQTTFLVLVQDPVYKTINVEAQVFLRAGVSPVTVKAAILAALTALFAVQNADGTRNDSINFGAKVLDENGDASPSIAWDDVRNAIRDTAGVRKLAATTGGLLLNGVEEDVVLTAKEFPALGNVVLINAQTGLQM